MAQKIDAKFDGKPTCAFYNDMRNLANFCLQVEKQYFILELNQNQNSKQPDRPDTV